MTDAAPDFTDSELTDVYKLACDMKQVARMLASKRSYSETDTYVLILMAATAAMADVFAAESTLPQKKQIAGAGSSNLRVLSGPVRQTFKRAQSAA